MNITKRNECPQCGVRITEEQLNKKNWIYTCVCCMTEITWEFMQEWSGPRVGKEKSNTLIGDAKS